MKHSRFTSRLVCDLVLSNASLQVISQHCTSAIPHLVTLLTQGSQQAKESAAGALVNLTAKTDINKFCVAHAGAIPPLTALLSKPYPSEVISLVAGNRYCFRRWI